MQPAVMPKPATRQMQNNETDEEHHRDDSEGQYPPWRRFGRKRGDILGNGAAIIFVFHGERLSFTIHSVYVKDKSYSSSFHPAARASRIH